jgi:hypothetical protein
MRRAFPAEVIGNSIGLPVKLLLRTMHNPAGNKILTPTA